MNEDIMWREKEKQINYDFFFPLILSALQILK